MGRELRRVLAANAIYRYCAEKATQYNSKCAWYLENPGNSIMWTIPFIEALMHLPGVFDVLYHSCMHGGSRPKWQRVRTNIKGLEKLAAECDESHPQFHWEPFFFV